MGRKLKKGIAAVLAASFMFSSVHVEAATYVKGGMNGSIQQGGSVWFNSSDRAGDTSSTDSEVERYLNEAKEKVNNDNASVKSNIDEQFKLMAEYAGMRTGPDGIEIGGGSTGGGGTSSSNYLSDEEYRELAQRLGANGDAFKDAVSSSKPNMEVINTIRDILSQNGSASDILRNENGEQKTGNDFFPDDYHESLFKDMLEDAGTTVDEFNDMSREEAQKYLENLIKESFGMVNDFRQKMKKSYVAGDPEHRGILPNGDVYEVKTTEFFISFLSFLFYQSANFMATCSKCGKYYGFKDGEQYTCSCGKTGYAGAKDHHFDSAGLDESEANDQLSKCQYCNKRITASNIMDFYYQTWKTDTSPNSGTFACVCRDCLDFDGIYFVTDYVTEDNYAQGHGHAFETKTAFTYAELEEYTKLSPDDINYCVKDADGTYQFPNHPTLNSNMVRQGTATQLLGEPKPYLNIEGGDDSLNETMQEALDSVREFFKDDEETVKFSDAVDMLLSYDDNSFLSNMSVDPENWDMKGVDEAIKKATEKMLNDIEKHQQDVIKQNEENNALENIRNAEEVEGIPNWDDRMAYIFGEWPSNYALWTDEMKKLYEKFINQYRDDEETKRVVNDMIENGVFDEKDTEEMLEALENFLDGYTNVEDKIKVTAIVDSTGKGSENVVHAVETLSPVSYSYSINGVAQRSSPWTGGYAAVSCHSLGSYEILRTCKKVRTEIVTGSATEKITWVASKGGVEVTLYEKEFTFSYYNSYSKGLAGEEVAMPAIHFTVVAGDQMDLSVKGGFTTERVY